uniref:BHLH domain-containing protein n=1 Tax=Picea sitchensis TaxID=3332 RepID=D5ABF7_PICSI|nr:unknown [Picea sitchensis]
MHFLLGATNSEIPPLGIGTRRQGATNSEIQHPMAMNHPSSSLQFFNQSSHGGSEVQTLINFAPPEVAQMDDLSAVVTKCTNLNVFEKLYAYPGLIPRSGCGSVNSIPNVYSQVSIDSDNNERAHCMHRKFAAKAAQPMQQFPSNKRRRDVENAEDWKYKALKRNRCNGPETSSSVSEREIHVLSERRRRSGMNQLFSKLHSFLPDQTAKTDKISVVAETINYIHYLQQRLRTRSNKRAGGADTAASSESHETDNILSNTDSSDYAILPEISVKSHADKDHFITIKCAKKGNLLPSIILVAEGQNLEVMDAFVSTNDTVAFHCLHLKALHTLDAAGREAFMDTLNMLIKSELQISLEP